MSLTDDFSETAMAVARSIAARFTNPDDDFVPVIVVRLTDQMVLIPADYRNVAEKLAFWNDSLPAFLRAKAAAQVTSVTSAWMLAVDPASSQAELDLYRNRSLATHPQRREVVIVTSLTAHGVTAHMAGIMRSANLPPFITEFELLSAETTQMNLVENAQRALADVAPGFN